MILALCGTTEGKVLVEALTKEGLQIIATVTTAYGGKLLKENASIEVIEEKLDKLRMETLIEERRITAIVDVTHPYAENISRLALEVSEVKGIPYFRYERQDAFSKETEEETFLWAENFSHAAKMAKDFEGKVFLTIGSNHLPMFLKEIKVDRLIARVLPLSKIVKTCEDYGFTPDNLIAMKGPFSEEMNQQMFKSYGASVVVTKDSGEAGGTEEKINAAKYLKIPVILVKRPSISYGKIYYDINEIVNKIAFIYGK